MHNHDLKWNTHAASPKTLLMKSEPPPPPKFSTTIIFIFFQEVSLPVWAQYEQSAWLQSVGVDEQSLIDSYT